MKKRPEMKPMSTGFPKNKKLQDKKIKGDNVKWVFLTI